MPAKNRTKTYVEQGYYHLYNRGADRQLIFRDDQDYAVYLSYLKTYLEPKDSASLIRIIAEPDQSWREKNKAIKLLRMNNFTDRISLLSYCLMPNHFHFLLHQVEATDIDTFMNSLGTRYTMYFNKKYKRVGPLFQGVYKAVLVETDEQLLYLSRYIHRNPLGIKRNKGLASQGLALRSYEYFSYPEYIRLRKSKWVNTSTILSRFSAFGFTSYESFVEAVDIEDSSRILISKRIDDEI